MADPVYAGFSAVGRVPNIYVRIDLTDGGKRMHPNLRATLDVAARYLREYAWHGSSDIVSRNIAMVAATKLFELVPEYAETAYAIRFDILSLIDQDPSLGADWQLRNAVDALANIDAVCEFAAGFAALMRLVGEP